MSATIQPFVISSVIKPVINQVTKEVQFSNNAAKFTFNLAQGQPSVKKNVKAKITNI